MKKNEGLFYTLEKEKIAAYLRMSTEERLEWLEDIMEFSEAALTPKEKAVRDRFRRGGAAKGET